jgi:hypothetical protein
MKRIVNGREVVIGATEEAEILTEWGLHDPLDSKRAQLIGMAEVAAQEALIAAKRTQIENMNEAALDAAIAAGGV